MTKLTYKLNKNRMEDVGFITELYIMTAENTIFDGNENEIDKVFADIVDKYDEECSISVRMKFEKNINLLKEWNIDYSAYNIEGVSHLYALWYLALYISNNQINADDICDKMNIFYRNLRSYKTIPQTVIYQLLEELLQVRTETEKKKILRKLQRYTVGISEIRKDKLGNAIYETSEGILVLSDGYYDKKVGVVDEPKMDFCNM